MKADDCPLCLEPGGRLLWQTGLCRVVEADDASIPGFLRVVLNRHACEMTGLATGEQHELLRVVLAVEAIVRRHLAPDKVNLASLGNVVPHVHWHVIPRWRDDPWFPDPIWAPARRPTQALPSRRDAAQAMTQCFDGEIAAELAAAGRP